jgi:hypothetical protein
MKKVPINKSEYSEESMRSVGHEFLGNYYEDIKYECGKCKKNSIFSAIEQQQTFEIRKKYMWIQRKLCAVCYIEMKALKTELLRIEEYYCRNKVVTLASKSFLAEWLRLLELYPKFGKEQNSARIIFVKKHFTSFSS